MATAMAYQWKPGARIKGDAQAIGERIEALRERHGEYVSPVQLVADARKASSPLHGCFEWDDGVAAGKYRLGQAGQIIRHITVSVAREAGEPLVTRAFVSVTPRGEEQPRFTAIAYAFAEPELRAQVIAEATRELAVWRKRYAEYEELGVLLDAVDRALTAA